jgi:hypothetical protein
MSDVLTIAAGIVLGGLVLVAIPCVLYALLFGCFCIVNRISEWSLRNKTTVHSVDPVDGTVDTFHVSDSESDSE